ncbi:MAG: ATP-binding protein [Hyphomicrobium sp.]|uniref:AAA family ATPase n=1 Tax=Hyphomicrobium sp. TaxID=82 RepID=UPI0035616851
MKKLIIVCGLPGSGKTTFASELSKKTGIVCLHKDSIKEKLFEGLNLSTLEESKRIGKPSVDIMLYLAEQQIANGIDIIIEAPFAFPGDYKIFEEWKEKYDIDLYSIICFLDAEERKKRFSNRSRNHAHFDEMRMEDHFSENEYDYASIPGEQIMIKTDEPTSELVRKVILQVE